MNTGEITHKDQRAVTLWLDTSLMSLIFPLAQEVGPDLYRMLIAHSSSMGIKHDLRVFQQEQDPKKGFEIWAKSLAEAGGGLAELVELDLDKKLAKVKVTNSWELALQEKQPNQALKLGCPFFKGKLIGLFFNIFGVPCWADEEITADSEAVFTIQPSERTIPQAIINLRQSRTAKKTRELQMAILEKTDQLEKAHRQLKDHSLTLEERIEQRTLELKTANKRTAEAVSQREALLETLCHAILKKIEAIKGCLQDPKEKELEVAFNNLAELELPIRTLMEIPKGSKEPLRDTVTILEVEQELLNVIKSFEKATGDEHITIQKNLDCSIVRMNREKVILLQQILIHLLNAAKINAASGWSIDISISSEVIDEDEKLMHTKISLINPDSPNKNPREIMLNFSNSDSSVLSDFDESLLSLTVANEILSRLGSNLKIGTRAGSGIVFTHTVTW